MDRFCALATSGELGQANIYPDRHVIFRRGDTTRSAFFLAAGSVEIVHQNKNGDAIVVKILQAPTLFGAIESVSNIGSYLEEVRVLESAKTHALPNLVELLQGDSAASLDVLRDMSSAFAVSAIFESTALHPPRERLANLLHAYGLVLGDAEGLSHRLRIKRSQADFAGAIGAGERSVNRLLAEFRDAGIIDKSLGRYVIGDLSTLAKLAGPLAGSLVHPAAAAMVASWSITPS